MVCFFEIHRHRRRRCCCGACCLLQPRRQQVKSTHGTKLVGHQDNVTEATLMVLCGMLLHLTCSSRALFQRLSRSYRGLLLPCVCACHVVLYANTCTCSSAACCNCTTLPLKNEKEVRGQTQHTVDFKRAHQSAGHARSPEGQERPVQALIEICIFVYFFSAC